MKRGKFKVCPGDVPYPLGAGVRGLPAHSLPPTVSPARSPQGRPWPPPRLHPASQPASLGPGRRGAGNSGPGSRRLPPSRRGRGGRGCGQRAGRLRGGRTAGGGRAQRRAAYSPKGPRGLGAPARRDRMGLRRARGLAGKRGETGRRCLRRRCCHRAINTARPTPAAAYAGRPPQSPRAAGRAAGAQGRRRPAGDRRGSSCAATCAAGGIASRRPRPPAPSAPLPPARGPCAPGPTCLGLARFCRASRCGPAGDDFGLGGGGGGGPAGFSLACQQLPSLPGGMDRLLKPTILQGANGVPRWEILSELQTF